MRFITLTKNTGGEIAINPTMIVALDPLPTNKTAVSIFNHFTITVTESVEEIQNKIKASEGFAIVNYDPKKITHERHTK
jgi:uncharacterized protein YlzI (FlbEa/FlbD family)